MNALTTKRIGIALFVLGGTFYTGARLAVAPTPTVQALKDVAFGVDLSSSDYAWVAAKALDLGGRELEVAGATVDEKAQQLVDELLDAELAR